MPPGDSIWDVVVVGAGPAGSMAAYEVSRLGKRVLLLEWRTFPRWKVCGATLSPGIQDLLDGAGLRNLLALAGARPLHAIRLGGWSLQANLPLAGSMTLSRAALDTALVDRAAEAGATVQYGVRVKLGPLHEERRVLRLSRGGEESEISARAVVAADGLTSGLLSQAGIPSRVLPSGGRPLVGLGGTFSSPPPQLTAGVIHMALGEEGYVGMVRVEDGSLNVAAALNPGALQRSGSPGVLVDSLLQRGGWPSLGADPEGGWQGTPELTRRPAVPGAQRLFAVGDASGYVEPFTGEGMFWALSGARALAPLAGRVGEVWNPALLVEWNRIHRRRIGRSQRLCRYVAWTLSKPSLSRSLLRVVKEVPRIADPVIRRVGVPLATRA
jgi:flavin-dependent dehydrogenase